MSDLTICIPCYAQPNWLAQCLHGLIKYSVTNPRILVAWSDPEADGQPKCQDTPLYTPPTIPGGYTSVEHVIEDFGKHWCNAHNVTFLDVTKECQEQRSKENPKERHGVDVAIKNNLLYSMIETKYVIPNWDSDFYPSPGWDDPLPYIAGLYPDRIYLPAHVVPVTIPDSEPLPTGTEWHRTTACNVLGLPIRNTSKRVTTAKWESWVKENSRETSLHENAGVRNLNHFLPAMYRTEDLIHRLGPFSLMGSGYEVEMNNRAGEMGFRTVTLMNSFILHKGKVSLV